MSGVIILPTLNRIDMVKSFVQSYLETKSTVPVWILIDSKDWETNKEGYLGVEAIMPADKFFFKWTDGAVSMGDKIRAIWPQIKAAGFTWVGLLNDDHYLLTEEWDKKANALIDGTNMVSTNDGKWNFGIRVCGLTAWSTALIDAVGFPIYPRNLQHLYIDDIWRAIGERTGCWKDTIKINVEHRHAYCGKGPQDETFKKVNAPTSWEYDAKEFKHFMEQDFLGVCERVMALRKASLLKEKHS